MNRERGGGYGAVTESGVRLLAAQKPTGGKGSLLYFGGRQPGGAGGLSPAQRLSPRQPPTIRGQELLQTEGGGCMQKQHIQLGQSS